MEHPEPIQPALVTCAYCGAKRPADEMEYVKIYGKDEAWYCKVENHAACTDMSGQG